MAALAKIIKVVIMIASLAASVQTLVRLARFAWALVIQLQRMMIQRNIRWVRA